MSAQFMAGFIYPIKPNTNQLLIQSRSGFKKRSLSTSPRPDKSGLDMMSFQNIRDRVSQSFGTHTGREADEEEGSVYGDEALPLMGADEEHVKDITILGKGVR